MQKPSRQETLRHRVLAKIHAGFGGCFLDNTGQFLRACRMWEDGLVTQAAKERRVKVDVHGSRSTTYRQWFKITAKGKAELARLKALGCKS